MTKRLNTSKGITLIALVITIIVLLILAGVAISMLSGENGILKKAAEAKTKTEQAQLDEQVKLAQMEAESNLNGIIHTEKIGNKEVSVKIPSGFSLSPREGEQKIETGMVIIDTEGNEYVWIPVFEKDEICTWGVDYSTVKTTTEDSDEYYTAIETALKAYTAIYKSDKYADAWYGDANYGKYGYYAEGDSAKENLIYYTNGNMTEEEYIKLYRGMLKSVYTNGGFYIGRYEMGISVANSVAEAKAVSRTRATKEYAASKTNANNQAPTIEGMTTPISKANAVPYNWITQSQAQMLAEKLGKKSSYGSVKSSIMFGVQWDAVCVFIEHYDTKNTATSRSKWLVDRTYGKLWGNYKIAEFKLDRGYYTTAYNSNLVTWTEEYNTKKGTSMSWLCTTGGSEQNKSLNIYDFGGNEGEWTLERYSKDTNPCAFRSRYFEYNYFASDRNNGNTFTSYYCYSSRESLYIK